MGPVIQLNEREITSRATAPLSAPLLQLLRLEVKTSLTHQEKKKKKKLTQNSLETFQKLKEELPTGLILIGASAVTWAGLDADCMVNTATQVDRNV